MCILMSRRQLLFMCRRSCSLTSFCQPSISSRFFSAGENTFRLVLRLHTDFFLSLRAHTDRVCRGSHSLRLEY